MENFNIDICVSWTMGNGFKDTIVATLVTAVQSLELRMLKGIHSKAICEGTINALKVILGHQYQIRGLQKPWPWVSSSLDNTDLTIFHILNPK